MWVGRLCVEGWCVGSMAASMPARGPFHRHSDADGMLGCTDVPSSEQSRHLMLSVAACSGRSLARFDSGAFSRVLMPVCRG